MDGSTLNRRIILIDSSVLMYPIKGKDRLGINIEDSLRSLSEGAELAVLDSTIEELEILRKQKKGKVRLAADFALEFIKKTHLKIIKVDPSLKKRLRERKEKNSMLGIYDYILLQTAKQLLASVATADIELARKMRKEGITVYLLLRKKWFKVSGYQQ